MDWKERFIEITKIPRASGKENRICAYLVEWAKKNQFEQQRDAAGNLIIDVPATVGFEDHPGVIIQGHMDMVCVKTAESTIDFDCDAIPLTEKEGWLSADGTSLGADNGVALAFAAAICEDPTATHPPLRLLFTRSEEEGLCGAAALSSEVFCYNRLINLDSEEDGILYAGCAGGITLRGKRQRATAHSNLKAFYKITLSGLPGGHSGSDIHKNRPNAVVEIAKILNELGRRSPLQLCAFFGGEKHNVIPSQAEAVFACDLGDKEIEALLSAAESKLTVGAAFRLSAAKRSDCLSEKESANLTQLFEKLPCGVLAFSHEFENTTETSANPAIVRCGDNELIEAVVSVRSLKVAALTETAEKVRAVFGSCGFAIEESDGYPAWTPNSRSTLAELTRCAYRSVGIQSQTKVIHAGLECGLFAALKSDLDMVSFGPQMENVHSVNERLNIESGNRTYNVLKRLLSLC